MSDKRITTATAAVAALRASNWDSVDGLLLPGDPRGDAVLAALGDLEPVHAHDYQDGRRTALCYDLDGESVTVSTHRSPAGSKRYLHIDDLAWHAGDGGLAG